MEDSHHGYLKGYLGKNMMSYEKSNHMGLTLENVLHFNPNKGHIKVKLENTLIEVGDSIQINNNSYTVSELMDKNTNIKNPKIGQIVTLR